MYERVKAFNRVNSKHLNILKTFLKYLKNSIVAYWRWFNPNSRLTITFRGLVAHKTVAYKTKNCTKLAKNPFYIRAMGSALDAHNWWECSGDELWAMNLRRSNFVAQVDKCDRRGGNQALWRGQPHAPVNHCVLHGYNIGLIWVNCFSKCTKFSKKLSYPLIPKRMLVLRKILRTY